MKGQPSQTGKQKKHPKENKKHQKKIRASFKSICKHFTTLLCSSIVAWMMNILAQTDQASHAIIFITYFFIYFLSRAEPPPIVRRTCYCCCCRLAAFWYLVFSDFCGNRSSDRTQEMNWKIGVGSVGHLPQNNWSNCNYKSCQPNMLDKTPQTYL